MKVTITKDKLLHLLSPIQSLVEKRSVLPILSKVLLKYEGDKLKLYATDQENSLQGYVKTKGDEGVVCVDSRNFFEIVKELPSGDILLEKQEKKSSLKIKTASGVFNMIGVSPADFPVFPNLKQPAFFSIKKDILSSLIHQTSYCISMDETRYHLNGVLCEKKGKTLRFVATDGHRLSYADQSIGKDVSIPQGVIIPKKGLSEMHKLLSGGESESVEIAIEPPRLLMKYESFLLSTRLIEGKYPNYAQLIPKDFKYESLVQKDLLIQALKRVSILSSLQSKNVLFQWEKKKLNLKANHPDLGDAKEEIPLIKSNAAMSIRFNAKYILESLSHIEEDEILWRLNSSVAPGFISTQKGSGVAIVMPMKL